MTAEAAKAELIRKNNELRRARNALQRGVASRNDDLSQLTQELIDSRKSLLRIKDELAAEFGAMKGLHDLSTKLLRSTEIQPLLEEILNATIVLQNADLGCVQLYNPKDHSLEIVAQKGFRQDFLDYFRSVHDDTTIFGRALLQRERVIVEDVLSYPGFEPHRVIAVSAGYRSVQSTPLFSRSGEPLGMISTYFRNPHRPSQQKFRLTDLYARQASEMVERKQAEESVRQAYERVDIVVNSISDQFFALSKDWRFTYFNQHAARQMQRLGKDPEQLIGKVLWEEFPEVRSEAALRRVMSERIAITEELYSAPLGEWVENHLYPSNDGGLVIFQKYITDRKRTEEALRRSEAFLAEGQKISHTGSWAVSFPSEAIFWSDETFRIYGLEPHTTKLSQENVFQLIHAEDRQFVKDTFERAVRDQSDFAVEHRAILADGSLKHLYALGHPIINASGELVEFVGTVVDISERKRGEESLQRAYAELAHATRVTMMGELAASIAHEINGPLGAIVNNGNACLQLIGAGPPEAQEEAREALSDIVDDAERASAIIGRIRALVQRSPPERSLLRLDEVLAEALALAQRELVEHRITVRTEHVDHLPRVSGDRVQLQQVFLNLMINAVDAMSAVEDARRVLMIRGQRDTLGNRPAVLIFVEDWGHGFRPDDGERLFDAFFTTKSQGMGMGLRISRSIVEAHGGRLWATANEVCGATFHLLLPAAD